MKLKKNKKPTPPKDLADRVADAARMLGLAEDIQATMARVKKTTRRLKLEERVWFWERFDSELAHALDMARSKIKALEAHVAELVEDRGRLREKNREQSAQIHRWSEHSAVLREMFEEAPIPAITKRTLLDWIDAKRLLILAGHPGASGLEAFVGDRLNETKRPQGFQPIRLELRCAPDGFIETVPKEQRSAG